MRRSPRLSTYIAKLITTPTSHMIASLIFFNNELTFLTLSIVQITFKKLNFVSIAFAFMHCKQTFGTASILATIAYHYILSCSLQNTLTILFRTHFHVRVFRGQIELAELSVIFLDVCRQLFEEICADIQNCRTTFMRTMHFLKGFDLINHIMMQTRLTKVLFMFADAHVDLQIFIFWFH